MELKILDRIPKPKLVIPKFRRPSIKNVNFKRILTILLVIVIISGGWGLYLEVTNIPPDVMVKDAIQNTIQAKSYRYQAVSKVVIDGNEKMLSSYLGEKGLNGTHLTGKVHLVNAEVDIYQIEDKLFRRDSTTDNWLVLEGVKKTQFLNLVNEIDPMLNLNIGEIFEAVEAGKEKIQDTKCKKYEVQARVENKYMTMFWNDFNYFFWIDKDDKVIRQAKITATQKDDPNKKLELTIEFWDLNKDINVTPPKI